MISFNDFRELIVRADNGYLQLFILVVIGVWSLSSVDRLLKLSQRIRVIPLPTIHLRLSHILLLALVLRIPRLVDSLWYDEAFTARIASLPASMLPGAIVGDVHPPFYYLIEWLAVQLLGTSELALRLPALLAGLGMVWLTHRLARDLRLGQETANVAALLVAIFPAAIYYSNEARGYALLTCLALLMVIAILEDRPRLFAISGVLVCWTHNLGFVYLIVLGMVAVWRYRNVMRFTVAFWLALIVASIWIPFLLQQSTEISDGFWLQDFSLGTALKALTDMTMYRSIPEALVIPVYSVAIGLTMTGLYVGRRWLLSSNGLLYLALVFGVPLAIAVASIAWHPVYLSRALLPSGTALAILWAYALTRAKRFDLLRLVSSPVLLAALAVFYLPSVGRADVRGYAQACAGADGVYATSITAAMFASFYVDAPLLTWTDAGDLNQSLTPEAKQAFGLVSGGVSQLGRDVCLFVVETPAMTEPERAHIDSLLEDYPARLHEFDINPFYRINLYRLDVAQERASQ